MPDHAQQQHAQSQNVQTLTIDLGERSYPIYIGTELLSQVEYFSAACTGHRRVVVVSNVTVAPLYLAKLSATLASCQCEVVPIILPDGEHTKNWQTLNSIFDVLIEQHIERSTPILALGGGVIGDLTGFAAACYQRGVPFIQVPTTLLAQVDSSVGGKTAINHPAGKNMIGAFYQPQAVVADIASLATLPPREMSAGLAEVIKYALIGDLEFFDWLEDHVDDLLALDRAALIEAVRRCCQHKADIVAADEREQGKRALLNLGHTFAHAIETGAGYGTWLHGEAVGVGTLMAAQLSLLMGWLDAPQFERIHRLFERAKLPLYCPESISTEQFIQLMGHDKKVKNGKLRLILLKAIGQAVITDEVNIQQIAQAIDHFR